MELRAFSICRTCFEVHPASMACPHCAAGGTSVKSEQPAGREPSSRHQPVSARLTAER